MPTETWSWYGLGHDITDHDCSTTTKVSQADRYLVHRTFMHSFMLNEVSVRLAYIM